MSKKNKKNSEQVICPWCNHMEEIENGTRSEWFTWTSIENKLIYLCWNCTDKVHSSYLAKEKSKEKQTIKKD